MQSKLLDKKSHYFLYLIFLCFVILTFGLFNQETQSLIAHDEGLYVRRALLILSKNDWWTPFDFIHHKTVGSYWLIALSIKVFGFSEFSARLPSLIFSILSILCVYKITNTFYQNSTSFIASLSLLSMPSWILYSRYASPDMMMVFISLCIILLLLCNITSLDSSSSHSIKINYLLIGILSSLGFFIRSFMIFLPLIGFVPLFFIAFKKDRFKLINYIFLGVFIGLIPTFIFIYYSTIEYNLNPLIYLYEFFNEKAFTETKSIDFFFYISRTIIFSLPVIIFSFQGFLIGFRNKKDKLLKYTTIYPPLIYLFILTFFPTTRLIHYCLIVFPFISINISPYIESIYSTNQVKRYYNFNFPGLFILILGLSLLFSYFLLLSKIINFPILEEHTKFLNYSILLLSLISITFSQYVSIPLFHKYSFKRIYSLYFLLNSIIITSFFAYGILGNSNHKFKSFISDSYFKYNLKNQQINLLDLHSKKLTLARIYLSDHDLNSINDLFKLKSFDEEKKYFIIDNQIEPSIRKYNIKYSKLFTKSKYSLIEVLRN